MLNAGSSTHHLHIAGTCLSDVPLIVAMRDNTFADVTNNLYIGVMMKAEAGVWGDFVIV